MEKYILTQTICRCKRSGAIFADPESPKVTSTISTGDTFKSIKRYECNSMTLYQILDGENASRWCPANLLSITEDTDGSLISLDEPDDSIDVSRRLRIIGEPTVTGHYAGGELDVDIPKDTIVTVDKMVRIDGLTKYRILSVNSSDQSLVGAWIVYDRNVEMINESSGTKMRMFAARKATTATAAISTQSATNGGELSSGQTLTAQDGNTYTAPNAESGSANQNIFMASSADDSTMVELYKSYGFDYVKSNGQDQLSLTDIPLGRMLFVHGFPFQYYYGTDLRGHSTLPHGASVVDVATSAKAADRAYKKQTGDVTDIYGIAFGAEIACNMPIVVMVPGVPKFLTTSKNDLIGWGIDKANDAKNLFFPLFSAAEHGGDDSFESALSAIKDASGDYEYYTLKIDTTGYFKHVNSLCQASARLMGLADEKYRGIRCDRFDWGTYNSSAEQDFSIFEEIMGLDGGVSFAYDPAGSISNTISNSTTESSLMSKFNDLSNMSREVDFITGYTGIANKLVDNVSYQEDNISNHSGFLGGLTNVTDRLTSWMNNAAHGMNIKFPEIWSETSHSESFDIDLHFATPYATAFCKWRYVLVPFWHIFCLAASRAEGNSGQYKSPYLIRAFAKGHFNVERGIIESLTWKNFGDGTAISQSGIPTQIDVSVSFKDLYHNLSMTSFFGEETLKVSNVSNFMMNSGLIDLIGTLSGVNMNRINIGERVAMFMSFGMTALGSLGSNFMRSISDRVRNLSQDWGLYGM